MYNEPLFLKPIFQERIWGGQRLNTEFNYDLPFDKTGEAWVVSAHPNGPSIIQNGPLAGRTLTDAWNEHGELFNKQTDSNLVFPLLVKIIDANDDFSVQVHPNDEFAFDVEGVAYGKTECWYVLSAEEGAEIVLGHHATSREELEAMIEIGAWNKLLRRIKVKAGDFVYIPSGTIHAIGKGIVILETQQSSDITYRVYDYDRTDGEGNKRELHLERSKQVITVPFQDYDVKQSVTRISDLTVKQFVEENYFTVYYWELNGTVYQKMNRNFLQVSVIEGSAKIMINERSFEIKKGSHFVLLHGIEEYRLSGRAKFIVSHE